MSAVSGNLTSEQILILQQTEARPVIAVVYYDTLLRLGKVRYADIKSEIWRRLTPINDYLAKPLYSNDQIAGVSAQFAVSNDWLERVDRIHWFAPGGDVGIKNWIESHQKFGAKTVGEFLTILNQFTDP